MLRGFPSCTFYLNFLFGSQGDFHEALSVPAQRVAEWELKGTGHHDEWGTKGNNEKTEEEIITGTIM